jgi:hypothetical protein
LINLHPLFFRKKYIDQRLSREQQASASTNAPDKSAFTTPEDMILMKAAEKLRSFKSKAGAELLSNQMLVGIPEVDLGIE